MSRKSLRKDKVEVGLIAACDESTKAETEAEATLINARISGTEKAYVIAVTAAIVARERAWAAHKALNNYRASKAR